MSSGTTATAASSTVIAGDQRLPTTPEPLRSFLLTDRQWPRRLRIAHAEYQLARSAPAGRKFWRDVLAANDASAS